MSQHPQLSWPGWTMISACDNPSFTLWLTGLHGVGKSALADLVKKALLGRGYKAEIIDSQSLSYWLQRELSIEERPQDDQSHTLGYDAFITYLCTILAHNGIITITTSVSPLEAARNFAREHIRKFVEIYLYCSAEKRLERLQLSEDINLIGEALYQPPSQAELTLDTEHDTPERSALRVIDYLEQKGLIAPLWEKAANCEEIETIKARLQALGYLE